MKSVKLHPFLVVVVVVSVFVFVYSGTIINIFHAGKLNVNGNINSNGNSHSNSNTGVTFSHVDELLSHVEEEFKGNCGRILRGELFSYSQAWQDWVLYHNYFRDRKWGDGFYLDIGTNNAIVISNTFFFDKCLGWRGICAEPQKRYHELIKKTRTCELVKSCVMGRTTNVEVRSSSSSQSFKKTNRTTGTQCVGFKELQQKYNFDKVDVVSIDIEGAEPHVLGCYPFDDVDTQLFLVETNKQETR